MVSEETIRQDVFTAIRTLLIANKPTYTYDGDTITYTIVAEYPKDDSVFPCIVINKSMVSLTTLTLDAETSDKGIEVNMDFYAKEEHGKKAIDIAQDSVMHTFVGNVPTFVSTDKLIPTEDFWTDSGNSTFQDKNQIINTATSTARFKLA